MLGNRGFDKFQGIVHLPTPRFPDGIRVMPPTKCTLIRTRERWRRFHASMTFDAVESVFVATSSAAKHRLGPSTKFHARVRSKNLVTLLRERPTQSIGHHFLFFSTLAFGDVLHILTILAPSHARPSLALVVFALARVFRLVPFFRRTDARVHCIVPDRCNRI